MKKATLVLLLVSLVFSVAAMLSDKSNALADDKPFFNKEALYNDDGWFRGCGEAGDDCHVYPVPNL
jgi:hypothetical protein